MYRKELKVHPTGANRAIEVLSRLMVSFRQRCLRAIWSAAQ